MEELAKTVYTKGKIIKGSLLPCFYSSFSRLGIAFPTCISVNNIISYFSPLLSDPEAANELKAGDLVKMYLLSPLINHPCVVNWVLMSMV